MFNPSDPRNFSFLEPERDLLESEFCHSLALITMNWGRVECQLLGVILLADPKQAGPLTDTFFAEKSLEDRKVIARKAMIAAMQRSYPASVKSFREALKKIGTIQPRRNLLAHGVWSEEHSKNAYSIQPMKAQSKTRKLAAATKIDLQFLTNVVIDMQWVMIRLASIGADMMAHQQLKKWGKR
jgi:hypothetical protein